MEIGGREIKLGVRGVLLLVLFTVALLVVGAIGVLFNLRIRQSTDGSDAPARLSVAVPVEAPAAGLPSAIDEGFFEITPGSGQPIAGAQAAPGEVEKAPVGSGETPSEPGAAVAAFNFGDFQQVQRILPGGKMALEGFVFGDARNIYQGAVEIPACPGRSNPLRLADQVVADSETALFGRIVACHSASFVFFGNLETSEVSAFNILSARTLADFPIIVGSEGRNWPLAFANTPEGLLMGIRVLDP